MLGLEGDYWLMGAEGGKHIAGGGLHFPRLGDPGQREACIRLGRGSVGRVYHLVL
jgi:hypothetical protein